MRRKELSILLLLLSSVLGCDKQGPSAEVAVVKQLIVTEVQRCPNGHTTIKAVPMVYGLIEMTPERQQKVENYEVAYGGCILDSRGKYKFVCTTCGSHTFEKSSDVAKGKAVWFDKTTKVIPAGKAIVITDVQETRAP